MTAALMFSLLAGYQATPAFGWHRPFGSATFLAVVEALSRQGGIEPLLKLRNGRQGNAGEQTFKNHPIPHRLIGMLGHVVVVMSQGLHHSGGVAANGPGGQGQPLLRPWQLAQQLQDGDLLIDAAITPAVVDPIDGSCLASRRRLDTLSIGARVLPGDHNGDQRGQKPGSPDVPQQPAADHWQCDFVAIPSRRWPIGRRGGRQVGQVAGTCWHAVCSQWPTQVSRVA